MSNISEENIKNLDHLNYISEASSPRISMDSYHDIVYLQTPPMSPISRIDIYDNRDVPMLCNTVETQDPRYFNRIDFFYYICRINSKILKTFWLSMFTMYLTNLLKYIVISNGAKKHDIILISSLSLITLMNSTLYKKINYNNPSIDLTLLIFLKKPAKKFIIRCFAQVIASILSIITYYYIFYKPSHNINLLLSYSEYGDNYRNTFIVIFINILFMFIVIKTEKSKEIYFYIIFDFILTAMFIQTVYNVVNPINDITTRLTLLCIQKNYFTNINVLTNAIGSFCGMIFGCVIYILTIDINNV